MGGDAAALGVALDEMRRELAAGEGSLQAAYAQMDKLKLAAKAEMARQRAQMAQQHSLVVAKLRGQPAGSGGDATDWAAAGHARPRRRHDRRRRQRGGGAGAA